MTKSGAADLAVYGVVRCALAGLGLLPLKVCFAIGWALGAVAHFCLPRYRVLARHNLRIAFGAEKSEREIARLAARHFRSLGANLLSAAKLTRMSEADILEVVDLGPFLQQVKSLAGAGRGVIMVLSHLGNWEALTQVANALPWEKKATVFQRLGNPFIDAHVRRMRARFGIGLFERKDGFNTPVKHLREGGLLGVLFDQHAGDGGVWVPFFGRLASTSPLPALLAIRTGAALLAASVTTVGFARWRLIARPVEEVDGSDVAKLTARLNTILETQIRECPADWFWVHNRWRTPLPGFLLQGYKRGVTEAGQALQPFRILIRSSNWLGDCAMTLPAVRAFKEGRPDVHLTLVARAKLAGFWKRVPWVDEVLVIEPDDGVVSVAKKIRATRCEVGVVFPNSLRVAFELWLAGVPRRVGYAGHRRRWLLNQIVPAPAEPAPPLHQVHHYLRIAGECGGASGNLTALLPATTPTAPDGPVEIGLCPGAEFGQAKRWIPERFAEVAKQVAGRRACRWVLFGTAAERGLGEDIASCLGEDCENLIGETTLDQLIDRLARCRALLTNDTGTMHLAAALGVPTVAIFGSTEPKFTGPLGAGHRVIRHQVECSPCFLRECPLDFRCMNSVQPDEVVEAVMRCLEGAGRG